MLVTRLVQMISAIHICSQMEMIMCHYQCKFYTSLILIKWHATWAKTMAYHKFMWREKSFVLYMGMNLAADTVTKFFETRMKPRAIKRVLVSSPIHILNFH